MSYNLLNKYSFVETSLNRNSNEFIQKRIQEEEIAGKVRDAVNYCKTINGIYTNDTSKIASVDKLNIEKCLNDNYLSKDSNYFGNRQTIFIDLV